jgi:hypothetical protein
MDRLHSFFKSTKLATYLLGRGESRSTGNQKGKKSRSHHGDIYSIMHLTSMYTSMERKSYLLLYHPRLRCREFVCTGRSSMRAWVCDVSAAILALDREIVKVQPDIRDLELSLFVSEMVQAVAQVV